MSSGTFRIREWTAADLEVTHAINEGASPAVATETREDFANIAGQSLIALAAEETGRGEAGRGGGTAGVVGFCFVLAPGADYDSMNYRWFGERYDDFVYLDRVALSPASQRRGLGRSIYAAVEARAAELRPTARQFTLEVNLRPRNDQSLAFHAALGFVEVGRQETDHGTLVSLMTKPL